MLTYERLTALFRRARSSHNPKEFTTEVGDEEENIYAEGLKEGRKEAREKGGEEGRDKVRLENEQLLAKMRQRIAELERRIQEGRSEVE